MVSGSSAPDAADGYTRTRTRTVTFRRPFVLSALEARQPAGDYLVESDEEKLAAVSVAAYRRVATWLRVPSPSGSQALDRLVNVDPAELEAALAADAIDASVLPGKSDARGAATEGRRQPVPFTLTDRFARTGIELRWIAFAAVALAALGLLMSFDLPWRD